MSVEVRRTAAGLQLELVIDGGYQLNEPSTVVSLVDDRIDVLRAGKGPLEGLTT